MNAAMIPTFSQQCVHHNDNVPFIYNKIHNINSVLHSWLNLTTNCFTEFVTENYTKFSQKIKWIWIMFGIVHLLQHNRNLKLLCIFSNTMKYFFEKGRSCFYGDFAFAITQKVIPLVLYYIICIKGSVICLNFQHVKSPCWQCCTL